MACLKHIQRKLVLINQFRRFAIQSTTAAQPGIFNNKHLIEQVSSDSSLNEDFLLSVFSFKVVFNDNSASTINFVTKEYPKSCTRKLSTSQQDLKNVKF